MKKKRFVIIDGHAIIHRAYYALPPMSTPDGISVNAVFGFTSMVLKVIDELKPDYLAVSFDVAGGTFRDEIYEDYKGTREKADDDLYEQIPLVYDVVNAFDIPIYEKEGFEADDVIGTLAKHIKEKEDNVETIIVTGDMDILQLVDDNTRVYELRKGINDVVLFDVEKVKEKYGFGPEMIVDYKSLKGDPSDNIRGVKGVGDKTAKELLDKIGGVYEIYTDLDTLEARDIKASVVKKLRADEENAMMSRELATIHCDVKDLGFKLDDTQMHTYDSDKLLNLFQRLGFRSLIKRLPGGAEALHRNEVEDDVDVVTVQNDDVLRTVAASIKKAKRCSVKPLLSSSDFLTADINGFVVGVDGVYYHIDAKRVEIETFYKLLSNENILYIGHDIKADIKPLIANGIDVTCQLFDIMVASYLINSSTRAHDLSAIALRELGKATEKKSDQQSLFGEDVTAVAQQLVLVDAIAKRYEEKLDELNDRGLFDTIEMPLISLLGKMEVNGIAVDTNMLGRLSKEVTHRIEELTQKIHKEAGAEFNVASSVQLREILYDKLELPTEGIKKGKTGYSTAASELEKMREIHPIIAMIEEFREIEKLRNTYIDVLPTLIHKKTGRIHTTFNQAVASTGRLSSSDPNLQNIPIRTEMGREIRKAFVAEEGYTLVAADYSQIELRIVASLAQDKTMIDIFKTGKDIHTETAAYIHGVGAGDVTKDMRRSAKEVNFGVLYGMGAYGLASRTGLPQWQAKHFIEKYFERFDGVKNYMDTTLENAKKDGYVETLLGRRRYIPELNSSNYQLRAAGERMAINMPIQGTAADLMKLAMIDVDKVLSQQFSEDDVRMLLQVHDEIVIEVKNGLEKDVEKMVKETMETVTELRVPIDAHVEIGESWGEMK